MDAGLGLVLVMFAFSVGAALVTLLLHWRELDTPRKLMLMLWVVLYASAVVVVFPIWEASLYG